MNKVKIIGPSNGGPPGPPTGVVLQAEIDKWIAENPAAVVSNATITCGSHREMYAALVYTIETPEPVLPPGCES